MARQPTAGGDNGTWGTVLNDYLSVAHNADGTLKDAVAQTLVDAKGDLIVGTAADTTARKAVGTNGTGLVADSSATDGLAWYTNLQWYPTYKSGFRYFCNSPASSGTSATLGNGTMRATPFIITKSVSITALGAEFTVAGEANSVLRLGLYADDGTGVPGGAAVLDAGTISTGTGNAGTVATGGTPGSYEITVSTTLSPGLYWVTGVVQAAPTTQPTVRTVNAASLVAPLPSSGNPGVGAAHVGYFVTSVSGALPTWTGTAVTGAAARVFFKVA